MKTCIPFLMSAIHISCLLAWAAPCPAEVVDAFIIIGQSNACGRSYASEFSDTSLAEPYSDNIHYAFRERSYRTGDITGDAPLGALRPHDAYASNMVGAEITLGRRLAESSENHVLLLSYTSGGTAITNFLPEYNNLYQPMIAYLNDRKTEMLSLGYSEVRWKGLFVVTGETDSLNQYWLLNDRLVTIQQSMESDLGEAVLPMVFAQLKDNLVDTPSHPYSLGNAGATHINESVLAYAATDSSVGVTVSNRDLDTRFTAGLSESDGIHYSADAYAALGERLWDAHSAFSIAGDLNADAQVNSEDLDIVRANWGESVPLGSLLDGDPSGDGVVNSADLDIIRANWGAGLAAVPEPSVVFLVLVGAVFVVFERQR